MQYYSLCIVQYKKKKVIRKHTGAIYRNSGRSVVRRIGSSATSNGVIDDDNDDDDNDTGGCGPV